ncbi:uncharacterized protein LOC122213148 [Panthera leo]|uniref:uncharacterized protein LOC122213148 n=1 Tax=Panthera leo TaxID=9689 RepID=UPI001C69F64F|nr:uncharacterized protein LOC122213148 [Panthera leo]
MTRGLGWREGRRLRSQTGLEGRVLRHTKADGGWCCWDTSARRNTLVCGSVTSPGSAHAWTLGISTVGLFLWFLAVCSERPFLLRQQPPDLQGDQPRIQPPLLTSAGRTWLLSRLVLVASLGSSPKDLATVYTGLVSCICVLSKWAGYGWGHKVFGAGTLLRVTAKSPDEDTSPKPTIFLPSNAERKLHKAGTYLCLLEDFFPDVIKIDWKEKNGRVILKSQQGDTMKIKDTYMKYTWLTVREDSMGKEHKCIVKHEKNKGGVDQEILFPSINTADLVTGSKVGFQKESETSRNTRPVTVSPSSTLSTSPFSSAADLTAVNSTEASSKDENDPLQLQLVNTSAYYTYLLLLVKSLVYTVITAICLLGRAALCDNGKSS